MSSGVAYALGALVAIAATVLVYIFILPEDKKNTLPKFFQFAADLFNFKYLVLEKILKALYIFSTLACIGIGFFMLFSVTESWYGGARYTGYWGLVWILLGPVLVRLSYEGMMLVILLVKNTIELNNKITPQAGSAAEKQAQQEALKQQEREQAERARQAYLDAQKVAQAQAPQYAAPQYTAPQYTAPQPPQYTAPQAPAVPAAEQTPSDTQQ